MSEGDARSVFTPWSVSTCITNSRFRMWMYGSGTAHAFSSAYRVGYGTRTRLKDP
jgi:hypothetical protein